MKTFELINPHIEGEFKRIFKEDTPLKAANNCYIKLSEYIRNPVNEFYYTLKNIKTNKYHNFLVKEKDNKKNKTLSYEINEIKSKINKDELDNFEKNLDQIKNNMTGGDKKRKKSKKYTDVSDSSDTVSDSDSSTYINDSDKYTKYKYVYPYIPYTPISYYWYYPYIYPVSKIFVPHFSLPLTPIVEIGLASSLFKY